MEDETRYVRTTAPAFPPRTCRTIFARFVRVEKGRSRGPADRPAMVIVRHRADAQRRCLGRKNA